MCSVNDLIILRRRLSRQLGPEYTRVLNHIIEATTGIYTRGDALKVDSVKGLRGMTQRHKHGLR